MRDDRLADSASKPRGNPATSAAVGTLLSLAVAPCISAQQARQLDPLYQSLRVCAELQNDSERLVCYDRTVERSLSKAADEQSPLSPEELFGLSAGNSRRAEAERPVKRDELSEISARVTELATRVDGTIVITLDNGQIWQRQDETGALMLRPGDKVRIYRAALGSFRLVTPGQRFARVIRVR